MPLLPAIRRLVDPRPTYGYRESPPFSTGAVSRRSALCQPQAVHRIMANHTMILEKHTAVHKGRVHDGKVMVMRSNLRWYWDGLEFTCWNGEAVRLAFISTRLTGRSSLGSRRQCRDIRFGRQRHDAGGRRETLRRYQSPHAIEHLSDNGSPYAARETKAVCSSPQSDPMLHASCQLSVPSARRFHCDLAPSCPDASDGWSPRLASASEARNVAAHRSREGH